MRYLIPAFFFLALGFGAAQAQAKSCSSFVIIKGYKADEAKVLVEHKKGSISKYFPKPEGTPGDTTKVPGKCKKSARKKTLAVKASGGRMSVTQFRTNFEGKMLNDTDSDEWFAGEIQKLIDAKTEVVAVIRPGRKKDDPIALTTIYLPAGPDDLAEIKRLEDQAQER